MILALAQLRRATEKESFFGNKVDLYWETFQIIEVATDSGILERFPAKSFWRVSQRLPVDFHYTDEGGVRLDGRGFRQPHREAAFLWMYCLYDCMMVYCDSLKLWGCMSKLHGVPKVHKIVSKSYVHFVGEEGSRGAMAWTSDTSKYTEHFHIHYWRRALKRSMETILALRLEQAAGLEAVSQKCSWDAQEIAGRPVWVDQDEENYGRRAQRESSSMCRGRACPKEPTGPFQRFCVLYLTEMGSQGKLWNPEVSWLAFYSRRSPGCHVEHRITWGTTAAVGRLIDWEKIAMMQVMGI